VAGISEQSGLGRIAGRTERDGKDAEDDRKQGGPGGRGTALRRANPRVGEAKGVVQD